MFLLALQAPNPISQAKRKPHIVGAFKDFVGGQLPQQEGN